MKTHFEAYNDTSFGKCFRFNSGKNMTNQIIPFKYSQSPGIDNGFTFSFSNNVQKVMFYEGSSIRLL